jgi:hypothetical protein
MEDIAAVHDHIDFTLERRLQCECVIGQEVMAATTSLDARPRGHVEAQV